jgi:hypothetical protein
LNPEIRETKKALGYRCPHCDARVEVERRLVGEIVACEACGNPFRAEAPSAQPLDPERAGVEQDREGGTTPDDDERVLQKIHPAMFRNRPLLYLFTVALLLTGMAGLMVHFAALGGSGGASLRRAGILQGPTLQWLSLALVACSGLYLVVWWVRTRFVTLTITTERSVYQRGLISRQTSEVRHEDVRNLQVDQNLVGRLLGVGSIAISSSGQDDLEIHIEGVPRPDRIAETVRTHQDS